MELGRLLLFVRLLLLPLLQQAPLVANMPSTSVAWSSSVAVVTLVLVALHTTPRQCQTTARVGPPLPIPPLDCV
ncbi:hypothetical protein EDB89DRAFT_2003663 [Lactarius sanguifluus]|nr:hypothetical protein EDB89DRAFT_2003663 [Lactarius sanguifluus]